MVSTAESDGGRFQGLPGADLIAQGLEHLAAGVVSEPALLVAIATPRLKRLGIEVPETTAPYPRQHVLDAMLEDRLGHTAHSQYNALLRTVNSFAAALEREASAAATCKPDGLSGNDISGNA